MTQDPCKTVKVQRKVGKGSPPIEHQFKKGSSGNPLGGKLHNQEIRKLKNLTEAELVEVGSLVVKGSIAELQALSKNPNCTALTAMMASVAAKAINKGDAQALDILLNRIVGKVKDRVEQSLTIEPNIEYKTKWGGTSESTDALPAPGDDDDT
jgi:N-acetylglucosamine kinase-like BadF-type ATPase